MKRGLQIRISPRYELAIQKGSSFDLVCNITNLKDLSGISVDVSRLTWYRNGSPLQQGQCGRPFWSSFNFIWYNLLTILSWNYISILFWIWFLTRFRDFDIWNKNAQSATIFKDYCTRSKSTVFKDKAFMLKWATGFWIIKTNKNQFSIWLFSFQQMENVLQ